MNPASVPAVALLMVWPLSLPAQTASAGDSHPVESDLKDVGKSLQRERRLLQRLKRKSSSLHQTMAGIDCQMDKARSELSQAEERMLGLEKTLTDNHSLREQASLQLKTCRQRLRVRVRTLYKMGEVGWLNMVFGADSVEEGLQRHTNLRRMVRADAALITEARRLQETIDVAEREIIEKKAHLRRQSQRVRERKKHAEQARQEKARALELVQEEETLHTKAISDLTRARKRLTRVVSALEGQRSQAKGFRSWRGKLKPPVEGGRIEVSFGLRVDPRFKTKTKHQGVDIRAPRGTRVRAVYPGQVVFAKSFQGYGLLVILDHGGGYYTLYAHLDRFSVEKGDKVEQGQAVGSLGGTGSLKGPYLYFEVREKGRAVNPEKWVSF